MQSRLHELGYGSVVVYCVNAPRNNVGSWPVRSLEVKKKKIGRQDFMKKDLLMAQDADYGFMIWDAKSSGTLNNVVNLLSMRKAALVYSQASRSFLTIQSDRDLDRLLAHVETADLRKIESRTRLSERRKQLPSKEYGRALGQEVREGVSQLELFLDPEEQ